jgi:hypothetical protein
MATLLRRRVIRVTNSALDGCFGRDRNRRIVITLVPGTDTVPDLIQLRPYGTRRTESIAAIDVYRIAIRRRVNCELLKKATAKKEKLRERRAKARIASADRRMTAAARAEADARLAERGDGDHGR